MAATSVFGMRQPIRAFAFSQSNHSNNYFNEIDCVIEPNNGEGGIFLGSYEGVCNPNLISSFDIEAILTLGHNMTPPTALGKMHLVISLNDSPYENIKDSFSSTNHFIERARKSGKNVLVHCYAGISRSSTVVIAYMMNKYKLDFSTAYNFVKMKRSLVNPNFGFVSQLREYESILNQPVQTPNKNILRNTYYEGQSNKSQSRSMSMNASVVRGNDRNSMGTKGVNRISLSRNRRNFF